MSNIVWQGNIKAESLKVDYVTNSNILSNDLKEKINREWAKDLVIAKKEGWNLFNGRVFKLESFEGGDNSLALKLSQTSFKVINSLKKLGMNNSRLAIGSFIKTIDGYYVFGRLSANRSDHESYTIIGGYLSGSQKFGSDQILSYLKSEIYEELGISNTDFEKIRYKAIYDEGQNQFTLLAETILNIDKITVSKRFNAHHDGEMRKPILTKQENLKRFILTHIPHLKNIVDEIIEIL